MEVFVTSQCQFLQKYHSNKTFNFRHIKGFKKESKKIAHEYINIAKRYQKSKLIKSNNLSYDNIFT